MADDEYDDMVERILDEDVDPNSVSEADIRNDLNQSNTSQIGGDNVDIVLENTLTVDDIDEAVGGLDETPTSSELGAVVDGVEDERVGSDERVRNVEDLASETYATKEDIDVALDEVTETEDRGYVSKEDVADAVGLVEELLNRLVLRNVVNRRIHRQPLASLRPHADTGVGHAPRDFHAQSS